MAPPGLAELGLGHRREHARRHTRGAAARVSRSSTVTDIPRSRARHAIARPMMPPPTIAHVHSLAIGHADDASPHHSSARLRGMPSTDPALGTPRSDRRERLAAARLTWSAAPTPTAASCRRCCGGASAGGVEIVQLREKHLPDEELASVAIAARILCEQLGTLLIVNDRPWVAREAEADGVHVGQDDMPVAEVRELVGPDMLIGLSTHTPAQIDAVDAGVVDYIGVGPIHETPTKPGRPAVGVELIRYAAAHAPVPFFAIGGLDASNLAEALDAGAARVCVLRAIAAAADPQAAAQALREQLDARPVEPVSSTPATSAARAALEPLGPDERPPALLVAVAVAALLAVAILVGGLTIHDLSSHGGSLPGAIFLSGILAALALGMYRRRYLAVLGFEALLALQIILSSLALIIAASLLAAGEYVVALVLGGWLFWKLVRVMGRIQAGEQQRLR